MMNDLYRFSGILCIFLLKILHRFPLPRYQRAMMNGDLKKDFLPLPFIFGLDWIGLLFLIIIFNYYF